MAYVPHTSASRVSSIASALAASSAAGRSVPGPWLGQIIQAHGPARWRACRTNGSGVMCQSHALMERSSWWCRWRNPDEWFNYSVSCAMMQRDHRCGAGGLLFFDGAVNFAGARSLAGGNVAV